MHSCDDRLHAVSAERLFVRFFFGTILASLREPHLVGRWWASRVAGPRAHSELSPSNYLEQRMYQPEDLSSVYHMFCRRPLLATVHAFGFKYCHPATAAHQNRHLFTVDVSARGTQLRTTSAWRFINLLSSILLPFSFRSLTPEGGGCRYLDSSISRIVTREFSALRCAVTRTDKNIFLLHVCMCYETVTLSDCVHPHTDINDSDKSVGLGRWVDSPATKRACFNVVLRRDLAQCLRDLLELLFMTDRVTALRKSHAWLRNAFSTRTHRFPEEYFEQLQDTARFTLTQYVFIRRRHRQVLANIVKTAEITAQ